MALTFPAGPAGGQTYTGPNGITYTYNSSLGVWTATAGAAPVISPATSAEAVAGTINTAYSSPATAVPKDAATMTGAAILPGGNNAARPATPSVGMLRYNNQAGTPAILEFYDGSAWSLVPTGGGFMGNVIYGTALLSTGGLGVGGKATVIHTAVTLSKSYIILNTGTNAVGASQVGIIDSRGTNSFTIDDGAAAAPYSYFLIY